MLIFRLLHHDDAIEEVPLNIEGRALELCGPAIRLFNSEQLAAPNRKALNEIMAGLSHFLRKKGQLDKKVIELVIHDVLIDLFNQMDKEETAPGTSTIMNVDSCMKRTTDNDLYGENKTFYVVSYDEICSRVMKEVEGSLVSPRTFECPEYGRVTHDSILSTCRSLYGAKPDRISKGKSNQKPRALSFDKNSVVTAGKNFEVVSEIKILTEEEQEKEAPEDPKDRARWDEWTNGRGGGEGGHDDKGEDSECTNVPFLRQNGGKGDINDGQDVDLDDSQKEDANVEKTVTKTEDMNDISKDGHDQQCTNLSYPQNDEKLVHWYTKDQNHAQKVVKTQCTNLESELKAKTKDEDKDEDKKSSQLADMAEANASGNGVMSQPRNGNVINEGAN